MNTEEEKHMNKIYGYCRISTMKQSIERQRRNIKEEYPSAILVEEYFTGTKMERPEWSKLFKKAAAGDIIVFDSVSRMSRNAEEGFEVYQELYNRGVDLVFLNERHIDTRTYKKAAEGQLQIAVNTGDKKTDNLVEGIAKVINQYLLDLAKEQIKIAFDQAEKEASDLRQRTREGIETARLNGKQIGGVDGKKLTTKKSISCKEIIKKHSKDFGGNLDDAEVMKLCGIARNSFYKYKRELRDEL